MLWCRVLGLCCVFCLVFERGTRNKAKTNKHTKPSNSPFFSRPPLLLSFLLACLLACFLSFFVSSNGRQAGRLLCFVVCLCFFFFFLVGGKVKNDAGIIINRCRRVSWEKETIQMLSRKDTHHVVVFWERERTHKNEWRLSCVMLLVFFFFFCCCCCVSEVCWFFLFLFR